MIDLIIPFLNQKVTATNYFVQVLGFANRIEREALVYPAIYTKNEFKRIDLDAFGSVSYWRLNGDVSYSDKPSETVVGKEYTATIPLKFVGFIKKDKTHNDAFFATKIINGIIGITTTNSTPLIEALKALTLTINARKYDADPIKVAAGEYENIPFEPRYDYSMFSIDYEITIVSNENCFNDICDTITEVKCGKVRIVDAQGELIEEVDCGTDYVCDAGGPATVHNSDDSFSTTVACGGDLELDDIDITVNVNGVFNQSATAPSQVDLTINISA